MSEQKTEHSESFSIHSNDSATYERTNDPTRSSRMFNCSISTLDPLEPFSILTATPIHIIIGLAVIWRMSQRMSREKKEWKKERKKIVKMEKGLLKVDEHSHRRRRLSLCFFHNSCLKSTIERFNGFPISLIFYFISNFLLLNFFLGPVKFPHMSTFSHASLMTFK